MSNIFFILGMASILVVVLSLVLGIFVMANDSEKSGETSNKMMTLRVIAQGAAIVFLLLAYLTKQ